MNWKPLTPETTFPIGSDLLFAYLNPEKEWQYVKARVNLSGVKAEGSYEFYSHYAVISEPDTSSSTTASDDFKIEREQLRAISFGAWLMANRNPEDGYSYDEFENIGLIVQDYEVYLKWCEKEKEKAHLGG